jgi:aspartyl aminopeptidase
MDQERFNQELIDFLAASPTPFHAVEQMAVRLSQAGFTHLYEADAWQLVPDGRYFITRNDSSLIAWSVPAQRGLGGLAENGFRMVGAHTDSPCLKVKPNPEMYKHEYVQLGVEVYGGVLLNPWFDRDLSIAGRVSYLTQAGAVAHGLIDFIQPVAIIPSLAIHLDREANKSRSINAQTYLPPILGQATDKPDLKALLRQRLEATGVSDAAQVLDYELFFYPTQQPEFVGLAHEFVASARLDNLLSCYIGLQALVAEDRNQGGQAALLVCNDHEEVGSTSAAGARGPMLKQLLERILPEAEERSRAIARSMLISADNAHGVHPNFSDRHDDNHGPLLNHGAVIKLNANQHYASNSETSAIFRKLAVDEDVPLQAFVVRSDMACGSTIGPLTAAEIGVRTLDVGVPQLAMHSIRELAGTVDAYNLHRIVRRFFGTERL